MAEYRLRRASIEDARSIAELHAKAWRETYLGVMRAEALASIDLDDWTRRWRQRIGSSEGAQAVFIACEGATPVGFARCSRLSNPKLVPLGFEGEIASIYLLRRAQRRGLGRRLMQRLADTSDFRRLCERRRLGLARTRRRPAAFMKRLARSLSASRACGTLRASSSPTSLMAGAICAP